MIKCENCCPLNKFEGCCHSPCPYLEDCPDACEETYSKCGQAMFDEETGLQVFELGQLQTLQKIAILSRQKKALEEQEKTLKAALYEAMERYGVKKFESPVLNLTRVDPTTSTGIDSAKLKKNYPDIFKECSKTSAKAGYVKITLKDGEAT